VSILDRVNRAASGEQRGDVQPMVGGWQQSAPQAYTSQGVLPDTGSLAAWMQGQMNSSGGLLLTHRQ
jgi:hypothetical protein